MLRWLVIFIVVAAAAWWLATPSVAPSAAIDATATVCAPPPSLAGDDGTMQTDAPAGMTPFALEGAVARPLAGFSVGARVLAREDYGHGREADFSPLDLALGWGRMDEDAVLARLDISQSGRFYRYGWMGDPPLPPDEIAQSSANMHMIPADAAVAAALDAVRPDDRVRIDGWLVQVEADDGWRWRSSLTRDDTGGGACELIYVCAVSRR